MCVLCLINRDQFNVYLLLRLNEIITYTEGSAESEPSWTRNDFDRQTGRVIRCIRKRGGEEEAGQQEYYLQSVGQSLPSANHPQCDVNNLPFSLLSLGYIWGKVIRIGSEMVHLLPGTCLNNSPSYLQNSHLLRACFNRSDPLLLLLL